MRMNIAYGFSSIKELSNIELKNHAPSIFAENAHDKMSDRYQYIPTIQVVDAMRKEGWLPTMAAETRVRDVSRAGFAKHMIRFRHAANMETPAIVGDTVPEIVLLNSHDGSSSYQLNAGLYRFVCANGMIVSDSTFETVRVRHQGNIIDDVIEGTFSIVEDVPRLTDKVEQFAGIQLNEPEQMALAKSASLLKWDDNEAAPIDAKQLLGSRRSADRDGSLWHVFNRVQENILKGGLRGFTQKGRRTRTRAVKSVNENARLNKALWALADEMVKLKQK